MKKHASKAVHLTLIGLREELANENEQTNEKEEDEEERRVKNLTVHDVVVGGNTE